jgi:hypothetical protein
MKQHFRPKDTAETNLLYQFLIRTMVGELKATHAPGFSTRRRI